MGTALFGACMVFYDKLLFLEIVFMTYVVVLWALRSLCELRFELVGLGGF